MKILKGRVWHGQTTCSFSLDLTEFGRTNQKSLQKSLAQTIQPPTIGFAILQKLACKSQGKRRKKGERTQSVKCENESRRSKIEEHGQSPLLFCPVETELGYLF